MAGKGIRHRAGNDPRAAALLIMDEVLAGNGDSQAVLDRQLKASSLVPGDKALCTELVYGALRQHLRLAWFIRQLLDKPDKLPPEMLLVLELAAYELAFTRIPAHASVNWAVGFIRNRFGQGISKVANGVLRRFQRELAAEFNNPAFYLEKLGVGKVESEEYAKSIINENNELQLSGRLAEGFLSLFYAMPDWIVRLWIEAYGIAQAVAYLKASAQAAPFGIRVNPLRPGYKSLLNELGQEAGAVLTPPAAVALPGGTRLPLRTLLPEGRASRQSAAAYEALWALEPRGWAQPVWDACAGRGGKSLALLEQGIPVALVSDANSSRLQGFEQDFERLFSGGTAAESTARIEKAEKPEVVFGAAELAAAGRKFGTVLLDVPCSGLGTLAHRSEIRWRRTPEDLEKLCAIQDSLLETASAALLHGGRIAYLTCTLNPAENQERVDAFLRKHPEFELETSWSTPPDSRLHEFFWAALLKRKG